MGIAIYAVVYLTLICYFLGMNHSLIRALYRTLAEINRFADRTFSVRLLLHSPLVPRIEHSQKSLFALGHLCVSTLIC